jgi:hypothetical protein
MADENTVEKNTLLQELAALEAQQAELRRRLGTMTSVSQSGTGAVATTGGTAGGADSVVVGGDVAGPVIVAKDGATIVIGLWGSPEEQAPLAARSVASIAGVLI